MWITPEEADGNNLVYIRAYSPQFEREIRIVNAYEMPNSFWFKDYDVIVFENTDKIYILPPVPKSPDPEIWQEVDDAYIVDCLNNGCREIYFGDETVKVLKGKIMHKQIVENAIKWLSRKIPDVSSDEWESLIGGNDE